MDKLGIALNKLSEEDPPLGLPPTPIAGKPSLAGWASFIWKLLSIGLRREFSVDITRVHLRLLYRETLTRTVSTAR
jgi:elongation factor G